MAMYEYQCPECGHRFEAMQPMRDVSLGAVCPLCGARGQLLPSVFASSDQSSLRVPARAALRSIDTKRDRGGTAAGEALSAPPGTMGQTGPSAMVPIPWDLPEAGTDSLARIDIFRELLPEQREAVAALAQMVIVPEREALAYRGLHGTHLYAILEGKVELVVPSAGKELTVRVAGPGESFPLACLLGQGRLVTTARAMEKVRALRWGRERLLGLFADRPEIAALVMEKVAEQAMDRYRATIDRLSGTVASALSSTGFWINL